MVSWESKWCVGSLSRERDTHEHTYTHWKGGGGGGGRLSVVCLKKKKGKWLARGEWLSSGESLHLDYALSWRWMGPRLMWRSLHQMIDASVLTSRTTAAVAPFNRWSQSLPPPLVPVVVIVRHERIPRSVCRLETLDALVRFYDLLVLPVRTEQGRFTARIYAEPPDNFLQELSSSLSVRTAGQH